MGFFIETLISGLMAGMLYALVALGFVLIFKASGVFNFAQGAMVLFAALVTARLAGWLPEWWPAIAPHAWLVNVIAIALAALAMVAVAWLVERLVLPPEVDAEIPEDPAEAADFARQHPLRQEVRMVAGATRTGSTYCALRLKSHDDEASVVDGTDLVPGLLELVLGTLRDADAPSSTTDEGDRR